MYSMFESIYNTLKWFFDKNESEMTLNISWPKVKVMTMLLHIMHLKDFRRCISKISHAMYNKHVFNSLKWIQGVYEDTFPNSPQKIYECTSQNYILAKLGCVIELRGLPWF